MCVDNNVQETIADEYGRTCRNEKCVYISANKMTSFYDCEKFKACCHVLKIPFEDQKTTKMFFGGDGTLFLQERRVATTKRETISIFEEISAPIRSKHIRT